MFLFLFSFCPSVHSVCFHLYNPFFPPSFLFTPLFPCLPFIISSLVYLLLFSPFFSSFLPTYPVLLFPPLPLLPSTLSPYLCPFLSFLSSVLSLLSFFSSIYCILSFLFTEHLFLFRLLLLLPSFLSSLVLTPILVTSHLLVSSRLHSSRNPFPSLLCSPFLPLSLLSPPTSTVFLSSILVSPLLVISSFLVSSFLNPLFSAFPF